MDRDPQNGRDRDACWLSGTLATSDAALALLEKRSQGRWLVTLAGPLADLAHVDEIRRVCEDGFVFLSDARTFATTIATAKGYRVLSGAEGRQRAQARACSQLGVTRRHSSPLAKKPGSSISEMPATYLRSGNHED